MATSWSDLSPRTRWVIATAAVAEAVLKAAVLIDLRHRPASQVRGSKRLWASSMIVNSAGLIPISYFVLGRRRAGDALLAPSVTRRLIEAFSRRPPEAAPSPSQLASVTAREMDVLLLLARGRSNAEIATALYLSEATVKTHVASLFAKLGLRDRVQAVILAYEAGLIVPGETAT
ncbi:MAG: response regulator transcription factor [Streptosporangiaceae bacterium]